MPAPGNAVQTGFCSGSRVVDGVVPGPVVYDSSKCRIPRGFRIFKKLIGDSQKMNPIWTIVLLTASILLITVG